MADPTPDRASKADLMAMLRKFIDGGDRSTGFAVEMEVAFDEALGEEEPFDSLVLALACYQPGGGEYLYDEADIVSQCRTALYVLERKPE